MAKVNVNIAYLAELEGIAQRKGTTAVFASLALEWAKHADAEIVRLRVALERIATSTGSDDPCQRFVEMARKALGKDA